MSTPAAQQDVAGEVRAQLARHRRTGADVARQLGWTYPYISRRLTGHVPFDVNDLAAIAAALDIQVTDLFPNGGAYRPTILGLARDQLRKQLHAASDLRKLAVAA